MLNRHLCPKQKSTHRDMFNFDTPKQVTEIIRKVPFPVRPVPFVQSLPIKLIKGYPDLISTPGINEPWTGTLLILSPRNEGPKIPGPSPPHRDPTNQTYCFRTRKDPGTDRNS